MLFKDLRKGLAVTIGYLFRRPVTVQYPTEKLIPPERSRWRHYLGVFPEGKIRCIDCGLCERVCPPKVIKIIPEIREDGTKASGEYEIDLGRCMYCGFCVEVCPELAILMSSDNYEFSEYDRDRLIYQKEALLQTGSLSGDNDE